MYIVTFKCQFVVISAETIAEKFNEYLITIDRELASLIDTSARIPFGNYLSVIFPVPIHNTW